MAIIYTYNTVLPASSDILLGTETDATLRNPTKNFNIGEIAKFIIDSTGGTSLNVPLFFDVVNPGTGLNQTTLVDSIMTQDINPAGTTLTIAGNIVVTGTFADSTGSVGTTNQLLASTVTGTAWVNSTVTTFTFVQAAPATVWNIPHNLGKFPSVTVINNNDIVINGEITYIDNNNVQLNFSAGFTGKAYLN